MDLELAAGQETEEWCTEVENYDELYRRFHDSSRSPGLRTSKRPARPAPTLPCFQEPSVRREESKLAKKSSV
eukprot:CAMPEP_0198722736 /NCGR_PEP_ID=MMETSP1475-20131203/357_1 /TAXON_ID= ORGANISM="Unidentified sp., Strain CCMP1999" /NCGR_SAMPLE_ID=MMETSP1475 /ASSEMBLY_ACC=CAM_ASM_001111 /LENGTH=71 /DNA_ID=CAMNT_0044483653 /DNA_START=213 /DNA_END=428 /DNA_ORIENTATION=-